jgi:hypothetical protein
VYLDFLTWDGTPDATFTRPAFAGTMWRSAWANAVDQYEGRWAEPFRLMQNEGTGMLIQGLLVGEIGGGPSDICAGHVSKDIVPLDACGSEVRVVPETGVSALEVAVVETVFENVAAVDHGQRAVFDVFRLLAAVAVRGKLVHVAATRGVPLDVVEQGLILRLEVLGVKAADYEGLRRPSGVGEWLGRRPVVQIERTEQEHFRLSAGSIRPSPLQVS